MTPAEVAAKLRVFNDWRRGELDDLSMPDPREIGLAIDAAVEMIEPAEEDRALCDKLADILARTANALKSDPAPLHRHSWHDLPDLAQRIVAACAALRTKIEAIEQQEPVAEIVSFGGPDLKDVAWKKGKMPALGSKLYALPGAQPAPSVPEGFAWPECPKRRQSHVLFDDGYEEGWAACMAAVQALLAAAPEAKPCP